VAEFKGPAIYKEVVVALAMVVSAKETVEEAWKAPETWKFPATVDEALAMKLAVARVVPSKARLALSAIRFPESS